MICDMKALYGAVLAPLVSETGSVMQGEFEFSASLEGVRCWLSQPKRFCTIRGRKFIFAGFRIDDALPEERECFLLHYGA